MILLDTNICIHVINARPLAVLERFREDRMVKSGSTRNRQALEMVLAPLVILPFDEAGLWAYGDLRAELERKGTPIGSLDTNNTREFAKVPGLALQNWVQST